MGYNFRHIKHAKSSSIRVEMVACRLTLEQTALQSNIRSKVVRQRD